MYKAILPGVDNSPRGMSADGFGEFITVEVLQEREKERVKTQLQNVRSQLLADGIQIVKAKRAADAAYEQLRKDLQFAVGNDGVKTAIDIMNDEIAKQPKEVQPKTVANKK